MSDTSGVLRHAIPEPTPRRRIVEGLVEPWAPDGLIVLLAAFVATPIAVAVAWLSMAELRGERRRGEPPRWVNAAFLGGLLALIALAALAQANVFGTYLALILLGVFLAWAVAYYGARLVLRLRHWRSRYLSRRDLP